MPTSFAPTVFIFAAVAAEMDFPAAFRSSESSCLTMLCVSSAFGCGPV